MAKAEYRSSLRSKRLINAALADLMQEKPLDKITVSDVVRRADINRGTFYAHYSDIPDVIHHTVEQSFCRIRDALAAQTGSLEGVPGVIVRQIREILEEDLDFYRKAAKSDAVVLLRDVLVRYLLEQEDTLSRVGHEEYVCSVRFCAAGVSGLYQDWLAGTIPMTLDELSDHAEQILMHVVAPK